MKRHPPPRGFTIIEVLISLAIFSAVILALVGLTWQVARRSVASTDQTLIMSQLASEVDRLSIVPFDSLPARAGCYDWGMTWGVVRRCVTVTVLTTSIDSIRIVVSTTIPGTRPDTISMVRARQRRPIPLR